MDEPVAVAPQAPFVVDMPSPANIAEPRALEVEEPPPEAEIEIDFITTDRTLLDEHHESPDYSHLDMSLLQVTCGLEVWPQIKFKFCVSAGRHYLEFSRDAGLAGHLCGVSGQRPGFLRPC